jgi:predicted acylesterase/phospholipase RssA
MDILDDNIEPTKHIEQITTTLPIQTVIKHIIISGGGVSGFSAYGVLRESNKSGFWNISNIKSIYGTSIGAIFAVIISLNYDWDTLDDYIIKRPWNMLFNINMYSILNSFDNCGILNIKVIEDLFLPLFNGKDIPLSITISEFYELTDIELHIYGTELNDFGPVDFNYKSYPDWRLIDAIYCSCCLPILFTPFKKDNKIYLDGGTFNNYPIAHCLSNISAENSDEIFGICNIKPDNFITETTTKPVGSLLDYLLTLFIKMLKQISFNNAKISIKNEIQIEAQCISIYNIHYTCSSIDERLRLIESGVNNWSKWISSRSD